MRRALLIAFLSLFTAGGIRGTALPEIPKDSPPASWQTQVLRREELPAAENALTRWRPLYERLFPDTAETREQVQALASPLVGFAAIPEDTATENLKAWLAELAPTLAEFALRPTDAVQLPPLLGPETPFPDHQPLRQLTLVRIAAAYP